MAELSEIMNEEQAKAASKQATALQLAAAPKKPKYLTMGRSMTRFKAGKNWQ